MPLSYRSLCIALASFAFVSSACDNPKPDDRRGPPPPPSASAAPANACDNGGGDISDPTTAQFFPKALMGYCVDPHGETRVYGKNATKELDAICTEAFNGDCEVYKSFGLERVAIFRYVDGAGSPGAIDVVVSKYASPEGAFGMFTKRVISESDPAREGAPRDMKVSGVGAQGTGTAYLWRSQVVVELTYTNDRQTPAQLAKTADELLAALGKSAAEKLPGPVSLPSAAAKLPTANRIPLGIRFEPTDAFEVRGGGAGAFGYYRDGKKRYRVLSITRDDEHQAKDVVTSILKREGATRVKGVGESAVRVMVGPEDGPRAEWVISYSGNQIFGVGDEDSVLTAGMSAADREAVSLTRDDKVERLLGLVTGK